MSVVNIPVYIYFPPSLSVSGKYCARYVSPWERWVSLVFSFTVLYVFAGFFISTIIKDERWPMMERMILGRLGSGGGGGLHM